MIKSILEHHRDRAAAGAITNGIKNCHVTGLTSIMLHDAPGNRIRLFAAQPTHALWRNDLASGTPFALGIHAHHCALRFVGLYGQAHNDVYTVLDDLDGDFKYMTYRSAITHGGTGAINGPYAYGAPVLLRRQSMMTNPVLRADELHTVWVARDDIAAWLVIEGVTDPDYKSGFWTNDAAVSLDGLYAPMSAVEITQTLQTVLNVWSAQ